MFTEWITYPVLAVRASLVPGNVACTDIRVQVLIGTGVGQIKYLNRALMKFDSKVSRLSTVPQKYKC